MPKSLQDVIGKKLATTHVGAFARPSWYKLAFGGRAIRSVLMNTDARELYMDALKLALKDQEFLGLDILTDNKIAYDMYIPAFGWQAFVLDRLEGVKMDPHMSRLSQHRTAPIMMDYNDSIPGYKVVGKLGRGNLEFAHFFKLAQQFTSKPTKFSVIDPVLVTKNMYNEYYKDNTELMFDVAKVYNEEFRDLASAGCKMIQNDDFPAVRYDWAATLPIEQRPSYMRSVTPEQIKLEIEAFNEAVKGVNSQIWMHLCWGRPRNQFIFGMPGSFHEGFKYLANAKVDVVQIEAGSTMGANLEKELTAWKKYCPDKDIGVGVINHRNTLVETPEQVAEIIRKALKFVPAERLCVSTDCGLAAIPRDIAFFKLKSLVEGTELVRRKL